MGFWYVATPYTKYPDGINAAFSEACRVTAFLIKSGLPVFSPIAHTHPVATHSDLDPLDYTIWQPADQPLVDAAQGIIVVRMPGWEASTGIRYEIEEFRKAGKPVLFMDMPPNKDAAGAA